MASRKKVWSGTTLVRYEQKVYKIAKAQGIPDDLAQTVAKMQTMEFAAGGGLYHRVRMRVRRILNAEETYVSPMFRAPYYAFAQKLHRVCLVKHEVDPEDVLTEFMNKSPELNEDVLRAIMDEFGLGRTPSETTRPEERGTSA